MIGGITYGAPTIEPVAFASGTAERSDDGKAREEHYDKAPPRSRTPSRLTDQLAARSPVRRDRLDDLPDPWRRGPGLDGAWGVMIDGGRSGGLTAETACARLAADGPNELPHAGQRSMVRIAIEVLREPMLALLLGGGVAYLLLGDLAEALILLAFATFSVLCRLCLALRCDVALLTNGLPPHT